MAERYPTSLKLDASLKLRVQRLALTHGRTAHGLLCDAIRAFVEQEEQRLAALGASSPAVVVDAGPDEKGRDEPRVHEAGKDSIAGTTGQPTDAGEAGSA